MRPAVHPANLPSGIHGVLGVLEELAGQTSGGGEGGVPEHFAWLPMGVAPGLGAERPRGVGGVDGDVAERFGAIDAIRPQTRSLRVGYGWVAGQAAGEDGPTAVFEPLVVVPVAFDGNVLWRAGDAEVTSLVTDPRQRTQLELEVQWGDGVFDQKPAALRGPVLHGGGADRPVDHLRRVARAAGFVVDTVVAGGQPPREYLQRTDPALILGVGLYAVGTRPEFSPAAALALWQREVGTTWTALHTLYVGHAPPRDQRVLNLPSAYELTEAQHAAVVASRTEPLTVIAGAPGTGKTHTIAAIVGDAVAHGRSVLVAAKADATVEAITDLLNRRPGPDPVVFGSARRRHELATRLAAGEPRAADQRDLESRRHAMMAAQSLRDQTWTSVTESLEGLALLDDTGLAGRSLRARVPGLAHADLLACAETIVRLGAERPPWWRRGDRATWDRLLADLGVREAPASQDLRGVVLLAMAARALHGRPERLSDGIDWAGLRWAADEVQQRTGEWVDAYARHAGRLGRHGRAVLGALATALRAGRAKRRRMLATLAGQHVTATLPVWLGTLGDIDDLLPLHPAMFDLVVLDEASSIDQPRAAAALLRARDAVVVGDPHQLRHVSFVPAAANEAAIDTHLPAAPATLRAKLDVRESSIFDVAAATAPVRTLDEHFRSAPHLFAFVGERLYGGSVSLARRTPLTDREDRIGLVRLEGQRDRGKVVRGEVEWVIGRLRELLERGVDSVGVVSPFRAQAQAIEDRALRELRRTAIERLGLRVGTVHAFQGMERDVVLASVGVGSGDGAGTWRFVNDPNLFAVFATRARERMEVVVSAEPPAGSLLAEYLRQVDEPPPPPAGVAWEVDPWTRSLAEGLVDAGVQVVAPYPAGRHRLDLVLHDGSRCLGVETRLHPGGPHAHARRHVELAEAGWWIVPAHRAVWAGQRAELVVALVEAFRRGP